MCNMQNLLDAAECSHAIHKTCSKQRVLCRCAGSISLVHVATLMQEHWSIYYCMEFPLEFAAAAAEGSGANECLSTVTHSAWGTETE